MPRPGGNLDVVVSALARLHPCRDASVAVIRTGGFRAASCSAMTAVGPEALDHRLIFLDASGEGWRLDSIVLCPAPPGLYVSHGNRKVRRSRKKKQTQTGGNGENRGIEPRPLRSLRYLLFKCLERTPLLGWMLRLFNDARDT